MPRLLALCLTSTLLVLSASAQPPDLTKVKSRADLDTAIAATADSALRQALQAHASAILAAAAERAHAEVVVQTIKIGLGKTERTNTTPESLKKLAGGEMSVFDSLKVVDLAIPNAGPHDHRKVDPYDAAFFEHVGQLSQLESLNIIATKLGDDGIAPIGKLTNLKSLRFVNNGKLSDAGLEQLAGLKNLEAFSFVGTGMKGHAFAKFNGWTHLTRCSFRGSSIDDEGLQLICERFPGLESLVLAHAKFTDAAAVHLAKMSKLKGLELGTHNATPAALKHIGNLPLEYLQLGEGFEGSASVQAIKGIKTLKRLTLTDCKLTSDDDLKTLAGIKSLESLELGNIAFPEARLPLLKDFTQLKSLRLVPANRVPFSPETQAKVKSLLPNAALKFE